MALAAQASISVLLIGREAALMAVSPLQNFWKPPPVPERPTVTSCAVVLIVSLVSADPVAADEMPLHVEDELARPQALERGAGIERRHLVELVEAAG